jgi:hypothetical protein
MDCLLGIFNYLLILHSKAIKPSRPAIYFLREEGESVVIAPGRQFKTLTGGPDLGADRIPVYVFPSAASGRNQKGKSTWQPEHSCRKAEELVSLQQTWRCCGESDIGLGKNGFWLLCMPANFGFVRTDFDPPRALRLQRFDRYTVEDAIR